MNKIGIIMGSDSDLPIAEKAIEKLAEYGINYEVHVYSAHRTPEETIRFAKEARQNGFDALIGIAGKAAHLAGVIAANTTLPVIGVPVNSSLEGMDALLSTGEKTSEVAQINANGGGTLSEDTTYLLERSLDLYDSTNGVFDIAIYPIMDAWGFTTGNYTIPSDETIESLLPLTDANDILYDKDSASISFAKDGMKIDFGGIAKGYTSGRIADIYRECGVTSGLINLGGNVQVVGTKTDGSKWRVAVQSPEAEDDYLGILSTADRAVITSGGYERYFEQDGMKYHHIIDPSTGHPANNGLVSVTIVSADGTLADGLSTSLFIMGKDKAAEYWRAHSDEFDTILEDEDGVLYVTEGIADDFTSDHETNIIRKDGDT